MNSMKIHQEKVPIWSHLGRAIALDPWVLETDLKYVRMSRNETRRRDRDGGNEGGGHNEDREIGRVCLSLCAIDLARDFSCLSFPVANVNGWASRHNTHTHTYTDCIQKQHTTSSSLCVLISRFAEHQPFLHCIELCSEKLLSDVFVALFLIWLLSLFFSKMNWGWISWKLSRCPVYIWPHI